MNPQLVQDHINNFLNDDETHPELRRFLEDFSILIEHGQFDVDEEEIDEDPYA